MGCFPIGVGCPTAFLFCPPLPPPPPCAPPPFRPRVIGANDRINVGVIGVGGMGFGHVKMIKKHADATGRVQITGVSDLYTKRKQRAREFLSLAEKDVHTTITICSPAPISTPYSSPRRITGTSAWPWMRSKPARTSTCKSP